MKQSDTSQPKIFRNMGNVFVMAIMFLEAQPGYAQKSVSEIIRNMDILTGMHYGLSTVVPVTAIIILIFLLIIYMLRIIAKATFKRWVFSTIVAGAAFYISHLLFNID
ncbi:conjugal transfer protein [Bartonella sp. CB169]|uniref:conjugal transfer protein n=1 Tax=Bartonella sp. CB169 TaxID=3112257 RepID=UPI00300E2CFD